MRDVDRQVDTLTHTHKEIRKGEENAMERT